ncbi:MAG: 4Fe-4S single cluster domain-containing protein [Blastocatellia bacterium]
MNEMTWIIDAATGELTIEGLPQSALLQLTGDLLPEAKSVNCARPINATPIGKAEALVAKDEVSLRVFRIYHNSVVEGPGRRSVIQLSGCNQRCPGCFVPETHAINGGVEMRTGEVIERLLAPEGEPRDGVTILGGEPFLQPDGLLVLMRMLKQHGEHITLYTGYTVEQLLGRPEPAIKPILELADILIDGPFVKSLSDNAGEWRGSTNQSILHRPSQYLSSKAVV